MDLLKEAFIEGYKQRAKSSNLIFDNASRMYAIALFDKWKSEQLLLHNVSQQRELLLDFLKEQEYCGLVEILEDNFEKYVDEYLKDK